MAPPQTFPDDENGDVLRRMQSSGDDLSRPRDIDLAIVMPTSGAADAFARHCQAREWVVKVQRTASVPQLPWDVRVTRHMLPTHAGITAFENELDAVATAAGRPQRRLGLLRAVGATIRPPPC